MQTYEMPLWGLDFTIKDSYMWFAHGYLKCLFRCDLRSGRVELIEKIPGEYKWFYSIHIMNNKLYLIPGTSKDVLIYDVDAAHFSKIAIESDCLGIFRYSYELGDNLYCIPSEYPFFSKIDSKKERLINICPWKSGIIYDTTQISKTLIAGIIQNTNQVVFWDLEKEEVEIIEIGDMHSNYMSISHTFDQIWLYDKSNREICVYSLNNKKLIKQIPYAEYENADYQLRGFSNGYMFIEDLGETRNKKIFDCEGKVVWEKQEHIKKNTCGNPFYTVRIIRGIGGYDWYIDMSNNKIYRVDDDFKREEIKLNLNKDDILKIKRNVINEDVQSESIELNLVDFMDATIHG